LWKIVEQGVEKIAGAESRPVNSHHANDWNKVDDKTSVVVQSATVNEFKQKVSVDGLGSGMGKW